MFSRTLNRSSHRRYSVKKGVLKDFVKSLGKHLRQSLSFNKVSFLKKRFWHRCSPVNFAIFLRTHFLQKTSGRLLLPKYTIRKYHFFTFVHGVIFLLFLFLKSCKNHFAFPFIDKNKIAFTKEFVYMKTAEKPKVNSSPDFKFLLTRS